MFRNRENRARREFRPAVVHLEGRATPTPIGPTLIDTGLLPVVPVAPVPPGDVFDQGIPL
jgi:hypothetical protein